MLLQVGLENYLLWITSSHLKRDFLFLSFISYNYASYFHESWQFRHFFVHQTRFTLHCVVVATTEATAEGFHAILCSVSPRKMIAYADVWWVHSRLWGSCVWVQHWWLWEWDTSITSEIVAVPAGPGSTGHLDINSVNYHDLARYQAGNQHNLSQQGSSLRH